MNFTFHLADDSGDDDEKDNTDKDEEMLELSDYDEDGDDDDGGDDDDDDDDDAISESEVSKDSFGPNSLIISFLYSPSFLLLRWFTFCISCSFIISSLFVYLFIEVVH